MSLRIEEGILSRGETHVAVLCNFINLMKLRNEFLRGKAHQYHSEEAKRNARACHVPWKNCFWHVRVRTVNLLVPSVRRYHSSYLFQQLENKRFQWVWFCVKLRWAKSVVKKQISQNLRHCLQMIGNLLFQTCSALKIELSMWKLQQKIILQIRGIHDWRFFSCNGDSKSPSSIRTAECFWLLSVLNGADSVRKIETGLECGQWLLRKLRNSVFMQQDYKRRPASEIVVADSRRGIFSAFA